MRCLLLVLFMTTWCTAASQVDPNTAAADIDRLIEADLRAAGIQPNPPIDDLTFARRSSLDLIGRIPSLTELEAYRSWPDTQRRDRWIQAQTCVSQ